LDSSQIFQVEMGTVEGVVPGTEFSAYAPNNGFLGTFIAQCVQVDHTVVVGKTDKDKPPVDIPRGSRAVVSYWKNEPMLLFIHIPTDFTYTAALFPATRTSHTLKYVQAASLEQAHIALRSDGDEIVIESQTGTMHKCQSETRFSLHHDPTHLPVAMDGIAHFNYFLERSNAAEQNTLRGQFALEINRLLGDYPQRKPDPRTGQDGNMVENGEARFASEVGAKYGFTIRNTSSEDLFPYLFYFDPDAYTIQVRKVPSSET
jgi:hypothetical protein